MSADLPSRVWLHEELSSQIILVLVNMAEDLLQTLLGACAEGEQSWHGGILADVLVAEGPVSKVAHDVLAVRLQEDEGVGYADCRMTGFTSNAAYCA